MKREIICGIYKITSPTGRVYIGESKNIYKRWDNYKKSNQTKSQPRVHHSLNKYSYENHTFEIVEECDFEDLMCRERYWQDFYNVLGEMGLNCKLTNCGEVKGVLSEVAVNKMRINSSGKNNVASKEVIDTHTGEVWSSTGEAAEALKINSSTLRGFLNGSNPNRSTLLFLSEYKGEKTYPYTTRKIIDTSTKIVYDTQKEVRESGLPNVDNISNKLNGKVFNNSLLMYLDEYHEDMGIRDNTPEPLGKKVIDVKTKEVFYSVKSAANFLGIPSPRLKSYLLGICSNKTDMRYLEDYEKGGEIKTFKTIKRKVFDTFLKMEFNTISEAAKYHGIKEGTLGKKLSGYLTNNTHMVYLENIINEDKIKKPDTLKIKSRKVINTKTNIIYSSIRKASENENILYHNLRKYLNNLLPNTTPLKYF